MLIGEVLVSSLCLTSTNIHRVFFKLLSMSTLKLFGGTDLEKVKGETDERMRRIFHSQDFHVKSTTYQSGI